MAFETFDTLQSSILRWIGRPDDPLVAPACPEFIALFEEEARNRIKYRKGETEAIITPYAPAGAGWYKLPDDYESPTQVLFMAPGEVIAGDPLEYLTQQQMTERYYLPASAGGRPRYYTFDGDYIRVGPMPDSAGNVLLGYYQGVPALSPTNQTNWLLTRFPSLYLFGSLSAAEAYIGDDERIAGWLQQREAGFERVLLATTKGLAGAAPLTIRPDGPTP
jgi:hypothetical protein